MEQVVPEIDALFYDQVVNDWPGELDFYLDYARPVIARRGKILEVACGTGRVTLPLVQNGANITALDLSPAMLQIARSKSSREGDVRWVEASMRAFELGEQFDLIIVPGHSFQFMLTAEDQLTCLETMKRHLASGGILIIHLDHQDVAWLAEVSGEKAGVFSPGSEVSDPLSGHCYRSFHSWIYEPATQTAISNKYYEKLSPAGEMLERIERGPLQLHCIFRTEMEHLLARAGLQAANLYGDFRKNSLQKTSTEMIWLVNHKGNDIEP